MPLLYNNLWLVSIRNLNFTKEYGMKIKTALISSGLASTLLGLLPILGSFLVPMNTSPGWWATTVSFVIGGLGTVLTGVIKKDKVQTVPQDPTIEPKINETAQIADLECFNHLIRRFAESDNDEAVQLLKLLFAQHFFTLHYKVQIAGITKAVTP